MTWPLQYRRFRTKPASTLRTPFAALTCSCHLAAPVGAADRGARVRRGAAKSADERPSEHAAALTTQAAGRRTACVSSSTASRSRSNGTRGLTRRDSAPRRFRSSMFRTAPNHPRRVRVDPSGAPRLARSLRSGRREHVEPDLLKMTIGRDHRRQSQLSHDREARAVGERQIFVTIPDK